MILAHWCKLIEGLQAAPLDFYKSIDEAIERRKIPGLGRHRVLWPEGGLLSAKREYLRLTREKLLFDICAAPFGTGFFVSCRLVDREFPWFLLIAAGFLGICFLMLAWLFLITVTKGLLAAFASVAVLLPTLVFLVAFVWVGQWLLRDFLIRLDHYLTNSPTLGPAYERITGRSTYYRIDATLMFQQAVQAAVIEVVDQHTKSQGLQPLSELERKPVLSKLLTR